MKRLSTKLVLPAVFAVGALQSALAQYTVQILNPAGVPQSGGYAIGGGQQGGLTIDGSGSLRAALWSGTAASWVDLHPAGFDYSGVNAVNGTQQGGYVNSSSFGQDHAALWSGSASSFTDMNPAFLQGSQIFGISATNQVGYGNDFFNSYSRPMLWSGTAASALDLTPAIAVGGIAYAVVGTMQAGSVYVDDGFGNITTRGGIWSGTAASWVDLTPAGFTGSDVVSTDGIQQVGTAFNMTDVHAMLWTGTAGSALDLNPAGFISSLGRGVAGGKQVGEVTNSSFQTHAALWTGTASSFLDLHQFLPATYVLSSAYGIAANGDIVGTAIDASNNQVAVLWKKDVAPPTHSYHFGPFLSPLDDSTTVVQGNRTIPVKVTLFDENNQVVSDQLVQISLVQLGASEQVVNEDLYDSPADNGPYFRANGGFYIYNLSTKELAKNKTYRVTATVVSTGQSTSTNFTIRK